MDDWRYLDKGHSNELLLKVHTSTYPEFQFDFIYCTNVRRASLRVELRKLSEMIR
jgi:hypothetical protein